VISFGDKISSIDSSNPFVEDTLKESIDFSSISSITGDLASFITKLKGF
jgi:hypothetical protein